MAKRIRGIGLDCFKTCLLETMSIESPYKYLISRLYQQQRGDVTAWLRPRILTMPIGLDDVIHVAAEKNFFVENTEEQTEILKTAHSLLDRQLNGEIYYRNPELDQLKALAAPYDLKIGLISDLAMPYGVLPDKHLGDVSPRLYSFEMGCVKEQLVPFHTLAEQWNIDPQEIVFVGDNIKWDYDAAKKAGCHAFQYRRNPGSSRESESINNLSQLIPTLQQRGLIPS